MIKIRSVEIVGLHKEGYQHYDFDDCQFLKGPNGAGKSTVLQAIQLGLLGYIPGTGKKISEVFKHCNGNKMEIILHLDNNGSSIVVDRVWAVSPNTLGPKSQYTISPDGYDLQSIVESLELPIFNFEEFMRMTSNQLKDWFVKFLPPSYSEVDWDKELAPYCDDINRVAPHFIDGVLNDGSVKDLRGVEKIRAIHEYLKAEISACKEALKRNEHTIQSLIYYDDVDATIDIDVLQAKIKAAQTHIFSADKISDRERRIRYAKEGLEEFKDGVPEAPEGDIRDTEAFKVLEAQKAEAHAEYLSCVSNASKLSERKYAVQGEIKALQQIVDSGGICPFTQTSCNDIRTLIDRYLQDIEDKQAEVKNYQDSIDKLNEDSIFYAKEEHDFDKKMDDMIADSVQAVNRLVRYQRLIRDLEEAEAIPVPDELHDKAYWENELNKMNSQMSKILANRRYNSLIDDLTVEKSKLNIQIEFANAWKKLTGPNGLQTTISETSFRQFEIPINKYIEILFSDGESHFKFNLSTVANSFDICIERGNKLIPWDLLSSGERCLVAIALLSCIVEYNDSDLKVILIDDMIDHLDDENIVKFFEAVKAVEGIQFIFAGVKNVPEEAGINIIEIK